METHMNHATEDVIEVGKLHLEGNVIPHTWYQHIKDENGKAELEAIIILSDIVYWYRPVYLRDEHSGQIIEVQKRFSGDLLQKTKKALADQFSMTERKVQDSLALLEKLGLICREYRTVEASNGSRISNVMFIRIFPAAIEAISFQKCHSYGRNLPEVKQNSTKPSLYSTKNTTENKEDKGGGYGKSVSLRSTIPSSSFKEKYSQEAKDLAQYFHARLSEVLGKIKKPNLESWATQMDDILRIDKRSKEEILQVIEFIALSHTDGNIGFDWTISIQCPKKLRDKFDKVHAMMNPPKKSKTANPRQIEQKNKQDTAAFIAAHPREGAFIKAQEFWVKIGNDTLYYDDPRFRELFNHYLQKQKT
jgi:hypothetical protein